MTFPMPSTKIHVLGYEVSQGIVENQYFCLVIVKLVSSSYLPASFYNLPFLFIYFYLFSIGMC